MTERVNVTLMMIMWGFSARGKDGEGRRAGVGEEVEVENREKGEE